MNKTAFILLFVLMPSFCFSVAPQSSSIQETFNKVINNIHFKKTLGVVKLGTGFITMAGAINIAAQVYLNHRIERRGGVDKFPLRWQLAAYSSAAFAGLVCTMHGVIDLSCVK